MFGTVALGFASARARPLPVEVTDETDDTDEPDETEAATLVGAGGIDDPDALGFALALAAVERLGLLARSDEIPRLDTDAADAGVLEAGVVEIVGIGVGIGFGSKAEAAEL